MTSYYLDTALRLPAPDVEALIQGRSIAVMPRSFLDVGKVFALCATDVSNNLLPVEQQYRSNFLTVAKNTISQLHPEGVIIKAWARCELCQILDKSESLEGLSKLTIWTTEALQQILAKRPYIFLAYLRVYLLAEPLVMSADSQGQFVSLPKSISVSDNSPILSHTAFSQRRHKLENRLAPLHPELEELQSAILQLNDEKAASLLEKINQFLGWKSNQNTKQLDPNLEWISTINDLGIATIGGNYEKGTAFEKIVHKSLDFLGFDVDPNAKGGAGGMDLYCKKPYPLVGECKAGKSIGNMAVKELVELGGTHLGTDHFLGAVKLVIGPGEPTKPLLNAADKWKVSIINPMTLQKLVELQAKYPGSVNLIELKPYLEPGQIDSKIDEYIEKVLKDITLRSHVIEAVKQLCESDIEPPTIAEIKVQYNAKFAAGFNLMDKVVYDLLVELSSPLTGYLGRKKGSDGSDRFYYLRDLIIENI